MSKTLNPKVFERAARLVEKEQYACFAIKNAIKKAPHYMGSVTYYKHWFAKVFRPYNSGSAWFTEANDATTGSYTRTGTLRRELALLFMAEMIKTDSLPK